MAKLKGTILIVDDDHDVLVTARMILKHRFEEVITEDNPNRLKQYFKEKDIDVVILDMNFKPGQTSGDEGFEILKDIIKWDPQAHVIMNTAYGDISKAVKAMKIGAIDFIEKPWEKEKIIATVVSCFNLRNSKKEVNRLKSTQKIINTDIDKSFPEIISQSKSMKPVFSTIDKVSGTDANVLILGENGTGKELVARAIHRKSQRANQVFMKVDIGSLTESLFESELFGHVKGAFTDAKEDKLGRFEVASGGTLFLDEIGNLSLPLQSKILTAIQSKQVSRVGSSKPIDVDIRLICATNQPLYKMVEEQSFRQDLLYRINTVEINLPPLRERKDDLSMLVKYYQDVFCNKYNKGRMKISEKSFKMLLNYNWPGNIRELQHIIERAVILSEKGELYFDNLQLDDRVNQSFPTSLNVDEIEKSAIIEAIRKSDGNMSNAAKELGLGRSTLYRKMKKYGIQ